LALASGYDWRSLGGEGKITWTCHSKQIESGKRKEILYRGVIFLGEFSHCGYKLFLKKLGKFVSIVGIRKENAQKIDKVYKLQKIDKK
jgi:hypothetical protein